MRQTTFLILLTFFTLILTGCQEKAATRKKSSSSNNSVVCTGQAYWTTPGCPGFCQYQPSNPYCTNGNGTNTGGTTGTTTGGTTGSTTGGTVSTGMCANNPNAIYCQPAYCSTYPRPYGCLANGTNCFLYPTAFGCGGSSNIVLNNPYWGMFYPPSGLPPQGNGSSCAPATVPAGMTSARETAKASFIVNGKGRNSADPATEYSPFSADAPNYLNTSEMLKSVEQQRLFFLTDSVLKLRIKVKPEPEAHGQTGVCYGRKTGAYLAGYTKLQYYVTVYSTPSANSFTFMAKLGPFTTGVNDCQTIDLSSYREQSPTGIVVSINEVLENKNCTNQPDSFWNSYGWSNCNSFNKVRSMECWGMEFEVASDGTKIF